MKTLVDLNACTEAQRWFNEQPNAYRAYLACERSDWLFWLAGKLDIDRRVIVLAACSIARAALIHIPKGEDRPRIALETTEAWCSGEATIDQVRSAAHAASESDARTAASGSAARTATYATYAAASGSAARTATYATYAAYAARTAAYAAYAAAAANACAANAAAYAAANTCAATYAAYAAANACAANAARTAAYSAYAAYAARKRVQKEHCKIIRSFIPWSMIKKAAQ